jgi:hypothetical protein
VSSQTAGYSFVLEFSQSGINKVVHALFDGSGGVPTHFAHNEAGQPGLLTTRDDVTGRVFFQRYLIEGLLGYELSLYDPFVRLVGGLYQQIELTLHFDLTLFRELVVRRTADALQIPADPTTIDPGGSYQLTYDSGLQPPTVPGARGAIVIILNLAHQPFGAGNRVTIDATKSDLPVVSKVDIHGVDLPAGFEHFVETVAAKSITTILRKEVRQIDVTSQFGVFDAFGVKLRAPLGMIIGASQAQPSLAIGMHEWSLVDDGKPENIVHEADAADYAAQIDEGFFSLLIAQLQNTETIPRRFNTSGNGDPGGAILLQNIRLSFEQGRIRIHILVDYQEFVSLFAETFLSISADAAGSLKINLQDTQVHIRLQGILGGIQRLLNTLTFFLFDALIAQILGKLLEAEVERTAGKTLAEFLAGGHLGFAFRSPIRNTKLVATIRFIEFAVQPGRALIRSGIDIQDVNHAH